jgi:Domain of unknown function (DUF4476)
MKKSLLLAFSLVLCLQIFAQVTSNVILFTENGERFHAILNGQRMNDEAVTNLKVEQLNQPSYKLKVIFENKTIGEMNKTLYLESGVEAVYAVKLDKKNMYKLSFRSSVPIAQAAPVAPQQQVVYWGVAPVIAVTSTTTGVPVGSTTTVHEQTTTTTTTGTGMNTNVNTGTGDNVSMNVNTNGFGMNVNINTNGTPTTTTSGTAVSTTTTTTTTTTGSNPVIVTNPQPVIVQPAPCMHMGASDFNSAVGSIKAKTFEDSKLTLAKQITSRNCLDATQVKMVTDLMPFESSKLEYAKYAYDYCWEKNNYFKVNDAFEFESTIEELDEYIKTR